MNYYLSIKWTTSRGRDTYGYNICTARVERMWTPDGIVDAGKWSTCRGGYDMLGTVVGDFLEDRYQERLQAIRGSAAATVQTGVPGSYKVHDHSPDGERALYGMLWHLPSNRVSLDGGCGIREMEKIADAIGVRLTATLDRKEHVTGYMVDDVVEPSTAAA